jgi:hypothetical protein
MAFLLDFLSSPFDQPVGAAADMRELEYISALLQTGKDLRSDGSLTVEDVARYLLSRHGIRVTPEYINQTIFQVFGIDDEKECELLDLVELTAMLVIPMLLIMLHEIDQAEGDSSTTINTRKNKQKLLEDPDAILKSALSMMFHDSNIPRSTTEEAPRLSKELIQEILKSYGMHYLANDECFIDDMILAAQGQTAGENLKLDQGAFLQALTSDVKMFKNEGIVVGDLLQRSSSSSEKNSDDVTDEEEAEYQNSNAPWHEVFTANPIDFTADIYPSILFVVCIWVCYLVNYGAFFFDAKTDVCHSESPGCKVVNSTITFLANAFTLM